MTGFLIKFFLRYISFAAVLAIAGQFLVEKTLAEPLDSSGPGPIILNPSSSIKNSDKEILSKPDKMNKENTKGVEVDTLMTIDPDTVGIHCIHVSSQGSCF